MDQSRTFRRLPLYLLVLLVPGVAGTLIVRERIRKERGIVGDRSNSPRPDRRQIRTPAEEEFTQEEEARRGGTASSTLVPSELDEPEGDGGELALFSNKGAKATKFGKLPWSTGLHWKVETYYRDLQNPEEDGWAPNPILWEFTVRGLERIDGQDVWVVDVQPTDLTDLPFNPGGSVYVSVEDHTLLAVRDRVQEAGMIRDRYFRFEDAEGGAPETLFPVFLPSPEADALEKSSTTAAMAPNPLQPDPKADAPKASGKVTDVEFEVEGMPIRERWDAATPYWPSYMSTPSSVSYLKAEP